MAILRVSVGASIAYHGINKAKSIAGTTSWFASIGMRRPKLQARVAAITEISAGVTLAAGLVTPLACVAIIALMTVAIITVHARVGYFIFLPNGGWEYCASIIAVSSAVAITGSGSWSLDHFWNIDQSIGIYALPLGVVFALCHLALCWRPRNTTLTA